MIRKSLYGVLALLLVQMPFALFGEGDFGKEDKKFIEKAARGSMLEIELGRIAAEKAQDPVVQQFALQMIHDHAKTGEDLKQLAEKRKVALPDELDDAQISTIEGLVQYSGSEFDREYMKEMVKDHSEDVRAFRDQAETGKDPELREFAANTLQELENHHRQAELVHQRVRIY